MVRKTDAYRLGMLAWLFGLAAVAFAALLLDGVGALLDAVLPGGILSRVVLFFGLVASGFALNAALRRRAWGKANAQAGLEPADGRFLRATKRYTGTARGRDVEVTRFTHTTGQGDTKRSQAYTTVAADLDSPVEPGVVVSPEPKSREAKGITMNFMPDSASAIDDDRGFEVNGPDADAFEDAIRGSPAEDAVEGLTYLESMFVGDATEAVASRIPAAIADLAGDDEGLDEEADDADADPTTVVHQMQGHLLDGDEMERQVDAVAAVAKAVSEVRTHPAPGE